MIDFLSGAVTVGYIVAAAFFLSFWRKTADRLFLAFAAAFVLFAVNQGLGFALTVVSEPTNLVYVLRILGFLIIIAAVVDKNLQKPARPAESASRGTAGRRR
jgi:hypothetical protein